MGSASNGSVTIAWSTNGVSTPLSISTTSLPGGSTGNYYSQTLAVTGGVPPYTWSITSGSLPAGLSLNASTGVIGGVPTTAGNNNCTVQVRDINGVTTSVAYALSIAATNYPDLIATYVPLRSSITPGQTIAIPITVKNESGTAAGGFYVGLYLSPDNVITTGDTYLGIMPVGSLAARMNQALNFTVTIPSVSGGAYYIGAIVDVYNGVTESNNDNNTLAMPIIVNGINSSGGAMSFQYGDGKIYTKSANGWYTDWTPPSSGTATIICNGASGGYGAEYEPDDAGDGGNGGFSAIALTSNPTSYFSQAAGGYGGSGLAYNDHSATAGNKSTTTGYTLSQVPYRIYVGAVGGAGDYDWAGTSYARGSGGVAGQVSWYANSGNVIISWTAN